MLKRMLKRLSGLIPFWIGRPQDTPDRGDPAASDGPFKICTVCETPNLGDDGSCAKCQVIARRKRLGVKKGQCTDCRGPLPYGEEIGMCRPCAEATWGPK